VRGVHGGALNAMKDKEGGRGGSNSEEIDFAFCISFILFYFILSYSFLSENLCPLLSHPITITYHYCAALIKYHNQIVK
jgi:hypothetical protein